MVHCVRGLWPWSFILVLNGGYIKLVDIWVYVVSWIFLISKVKKTRSQNQNNNDFFLTSTLEILLILKIRKIVMGLIIMVKITWTALRCNFSHNLRFFFPVSQSDQKYARVRYLGSVGINRRWEYWFIKCKFAHVERNRC